MKKDKRNNHHQRQLAPTHWNRFWRLLRFFFVFSSGQFKCNTVMMMIINEWINWTAMPEHTNKTKMEKNQQIKHTHTHIRIDWKSKKNFVFSCELKQQSNFFSGWRKFSFQSNIRHEWMCHSNSNVNYLLLTMSLWYAFCSFFRFSFSFPLFNMFLPLTVECLKKPRRIKWLEAIWKFGINFLSWWN